MAESLVSASGHVTEIIIIISVFKVDRRVNIELTAGYPGGDQARHSCAAARAARGAIAGGLRARASPRHRPAAVQLGPAGHHSDRVPDVQQAPTTHGGLRASVWHAHVHVRCTGRLLFLCFAMVFRAWPCPCIVRKRMGVV